MRSAGKLVGVASAVMVVGLVGGAVLAAPDQVLPMAQAAVHVVAERSGPLLADGASALSVWSGSVREAVDGASTRTLAMIAVGALAIIFALAAVVTSRRSQRGKPVSAPGTVAFSSGTPLSPRRANGRNSRPTPSQVHALAAQGKSLPDIARGTGLPVDAIALLIAVADPARQLPHSTA